ncbi:AraC family transcriptional regulator [Paenibacillus tarimensis]|uniref:AraC family transcriptional regulator n=1 Tax=Paenibacillus tarimensis TaxID=416012 RepID=UPI001F306493|nr:helix-turn-helix domain-containing protein [Paenibacillus tarimensis]MCF2943126.1 helix-turn-helix domain-containing protein [Paenibacillus tarimensis]
MDYLKAIQRFADEVEDQLESSIHIDRLIELTYVSKFHFYRLFKAVVGISVYDYIRKRKLIRAADDLRKTQHSVLDIAIKYGFGSQEVFSRNFKKLYHTSPAKYRSCYTGEDRLAEDTVSKLDIESIWLEIRAKHGNVIVSDFFEKIEGLKLIGIERPSCDENIKTIDPFVHVFLQQAEQIPNRKSDHLYRLCYDITFVGETAHFKEMVAVEVEELVNVPSGMKPFVVDGLNMIKFVHIGKLFSEQKDDILSTYHFLYQYRIPASNAILTSELLLEKYEPTFVSPYADDAKVEIYLSVE